MLVQPTSAHVDLLRMVDNPEHADVTFKLDNTLGFAFNPMGEYADTGALPSPTAGAFAAAIEAGGAFSESKDGSEGVASGAAASSATSMVLGHSWLLCSRSSRFEALLSSGMLESTTKQVGLIE